MNGLPNDWVNWNIRILRIAQKCCNCFFGFHFWSIFDLVLHLSIRWFHLLSCLRKWHSNEWWTQCFGVHFHTGTAQILICPNLHVRRLCTHTNSSVSFNIFRFSINNGKKESEIFSDSFCGERSSVKPCFVFVSLFGLYTWERSHPRTAEPTLNEQN